MDDSPSRDEWTGALVAAAVGPRGSIWTASTAGLLGWALDPVRVVHRLPVGRVVLAAFDGDRRAATLAEGGRLSFVDLHDGVVQREVEDAPMSDARTLTFLDDARVLLTGGSDPTIYAWDGAPPERLDPASRVPHLPRATSAPAHAPLTLHVDRYEGRVEVLEARERVAVIECFAEHTELVPAGASRAVLIATVVDGQNSFASLQLWDVDRDQPLAMLVDRSSVLHYDILAREGRIAFADEEQICVAALSDGRIERRKALYDDESFELEYIETLAFDDDGDLRVALQGYCDEGRCRDVRALRLRTGRWRRVQREIEAPEDEAPEDVAPAAPRPPALEPFPTRYWQSYESTRGRPRAELHAWVLDRLPPSFVRLGDDDPAGRQRLRVRHEPTGIELGLTVVEREPLLVGRTPVTNRQWRAGGGAPKAASPDELDHPVVGVSWSEVTAWLRDVGDLSLPRSGVWERFAGAESGTNFWWGKRVKDALCWHRGNSGGVLHPVDEHGENPCGLIDVHGNVGELVSDLHGKDAVFRGGSFRLDAMESATNMRASIGVDETRDDVGFRVVHGVRPRVLG